MMPKFIKFRVCWLWLVLVAGLITACGAAAPSNQAAESVMPAAAPPVREKAGVAPMATAAPAQPGLDYDSESSVEDILKRAADEAHAQERIIVYTGQMTLVVKDTKEAITAITGLAGEKGGYVAGSNVYESGDVLRGSITIRVPAEKYQEVVAGLRALAVRVERETSNTQDVTEEFTDLQARKTNLEVAEKALQKLLEDRQRTGSTEDILNVYRELTNVRGQIEQIEGRLRYLANQSALSTITIELIPDVLSQPVSVAGWEPQGTAKEALQALVSALQGLANLTIWLVIFLLPLLIVLLLPIVVVVVIIRWAWKRRRATKQA